jgi:uncharacterized sulfatase
MLRWPGRIAPARDDEHAVSSVDLAPTILRACGIEPAAAMPGIDLLDAAAVSRREAVFGAIFTHDAVDIRRPAANVMYRWCVAGRWKLIVPDAAIVPDRQAELYDVVADPLETSDLLAARPRDAARLRALLDAWWPAR